MYYIINYYTDEEIAGVFYENKLQKTDQKEFRIEKVIKRKGDKHSFFNSCIDKKDSINKKIFSRTEIFNRKSESWIRFV